MARSSRADRQRAADALSQMTSGQNAEPVEVHQVQQPVYYADQPSALYPRDARVVVTIERTSKGLKLQRAFASFLLFMAVLILILGAAARDRLGDFALAPVAIGGALAVVSLVWLLVVRAKIWWRHG